MVVLRVTHKLAQILPPAAGVPRSSNTALGDWYVHQVTVGSESLALLVSSRSLLAMLVPAARLPDLPQRLAALVAVRLKRLGIPGRLIAAERQAMRPVVVARTADRSVVSIMVEYARMIPRYLSKGDWDLTSLPFLEANLQDYPWHSYGRMADIIFPRRAVPRLLADRWHAA